MMTPRADSEMDSPAPFSGGEQQSAASAVGPSIALCRSSRQRGQHMLRRCRFRGFSFTEILFAVVVLGIGFIMVAAIFPVAIQQGKLTSEQGSATGVAREALSYLGQVGANSDATPDSLGGPLFPATGITGSAAPYVGLVYSMRDPQPAGATYPLNTAVAPSKNPLLPAIVNPAAPGDSLWNRLKLSLIVPSDQRYAFVGLYRRNGDPTDRRTWSPFVQTWFIPVTPRSRSIYNFITDPNVTAPANQNLQARLVKVSIDADPLSPYSTSGSVHYILYNWTSTSIATSPNYQPGSLSENCYVIIANDQITTVGATTSSANTGRMNGHIYHVGLRRPDLDSTTPTTVTAYDLAADGDFAPDPGGDGYFGSTDDILTIGMTYAAPSGAPPYSPNQPMSLGGSGFNGMSPYGDASGPADAYVVGLDNSPGADPGTSQEISAFTTFIKVN